MIQMAGGKHEEKKLVRYVSKAKRNSGRDRDAAYLQKDPEDRHDEGDWPHNKNQEN
jgi:hypothetical protein